jgi:GDPmannose 4,6-dehydratase
LIRRASTFHTQRLDHLYQDPHDPDTRLFLHYGDLSDSSQLTNLFYEVRPDEVYHVGAQSHVRVSFDLPDYTGDVTGLGTVRLLEAIRRSGSRCRLYQAASSEMFGDAPAPQNEKTPFRPRSPYAAAKVYAYWMVRNYREGRVKFRDLVRIMIDADLEAAEVPAPGEGRRCVPDGRLPWLRRP